MCTPKEIEIILTKANVKATATLLEDETPRICQAIWDLLPVEREAVHASWSGECLLIVPFGAQAPARKSENETIYVGPGEVALDCPADEVLIFYGRGQPRWRMGPSRVNVFARITNNLKGFAEACDKLRREGAQTVTIRKKE
jgi:hypothetical protein